MPIIDNPVISWTIAKEMKKKVYILGSLVVVGVGVGVYFCDKIVPPKKEEAIPYRIALPDPKTGIRPELPLENYVREHGQKLAKKKLFAPKIALYERLLKKQPESLDIKKQLGLNYFYAEMYDEAKPLLKEIESSNRADAVLFYALAKMAWVGEEQTLAQQYLDKSLAMNPTHPESLKLSEEIKNPSLPRE